MHAPSTSYDAIVVGLGAVGSSTTYELAKRGLRVLGLDRYAPPHSYGSSHGGSRIIREAYFEGSEYVPLVRRAYELWAELERDSRVALLTPTGGLTIGAPDGELVSGALRSARMHGIAHELLGPKDVAQRFPEFRLDDGMAAVYEERAGVLDPEACVAASIAEAVKHGAEIRTGERVSNWSASPGGVKVETADGTVAGKTLVLATGAWLAATLRPLNLGLWVERQVMHWFGPAARQTSAERVAAPVTVWQFSPDFMIHTTPDLGGGSKVAIHHSGEPVTPETIRRDVSLQEVADIEALVARYIPGLEPRVLRSATCMYTNTPDQHFLIDRMSARNVVIASACSGHGFKFAPAVGEIVARLATDADVQTPELFKMRRA
ncbi:MAG TPA: N-methyl-L-tryptophan oxidase [Gemmatimonadaceae bacterium]